MKGFTYIVGFIAAAFIITSCETEEPPTDPNPTPDGKATLVIDFDYVWAMAGNSFELQTDLVHPMTGDSLNFSTFKHYISNIKLIKSDDTEWVEDESYYLLDLADPSSTMLTIEDIPAGSYKGIEITFGVDSARNVSGSQTGALDPVYGMFWTWNSGYIMLKAEGASPQSSTGLFSYHLGGFTGDHKAVSTRVLSFPNNTSRDVKDGEQLTVRIQANPARLFHTYGSVSNGHTMHLPGRDAGIMANDFNSWTNITEVL